MAATSSQPQPQLGLKDGRLVEMEGIMEVRVVSEDVDTDTVAEDLFHFQETNKHITEEMFKKNKQTSEQTHVFCLVCNCEIRNMNSLQDHVSGKKHIQKSLFLKRQFLGLSQEPPNAPRLKKAASLRPRPVVDVGLTLEARLRDCGLPALGLDSVTEVTHPEDSRAHPLYTCGLAGCKSAWGTSDDMFHHVTNCKHQRNFLKRLHPEDTRILSMTRNEVLDLASKYEADWGGPEDRDYGLIRIVRDSKEYLYLRNRPLDWSERKDVRPNSEGSSTNGKRKQDEEDHEDFLRLKAKRIDETKNNCLAQVEESARRGVNDVHEMIDDILMGKRDKTPEDVKFYIDSYSKILSFFQTEDNQSLRERINSLREELLSLEPSRILLVNRKDE